MTTNKEKFEYTHALEADGQQFHVRSMIPYNEKEQFA